MATSQGRLAFTSNPQKNIALVDFAARHSTSLGSQDRRAENLARRPAEIRARLQLAEDYSKAVQVKI